jgi:tetratricopeptide (TPR) repeat protein
MRVRHALGLVFLAATLSTSAFADTKGASAKGAASKDGIRRDPEGKKGISPYMELIVKGNAAFVARDLEGAKAAFQEAIKSEPTKMLGFARLGEVEVETGKLDDAGKTWESGLTKKGTQTLKAKIMFCLADLAERQGKWQAAKEAWAAYSVYVQGNPKVKGYTETAAERIKQAERRMKDEATYAAVKERIAKRIAEKEREAVENAKKDKHNR